MKRVLCLSTLFVLAACAAPSETTSDSNGALTNMPDQIRTVTKHLGRAMFECPDRVWPGIGAKYHASQVLITSRADDQAWLWNDQNATPAPATTPMGLDGLGSEWFATYNTSTYQGVPTLGLNLDELKKVDAQYTALGIQWLGNTEMFAFHEGFHSMAGQNTWPRPEGSTRSAPYPERWEPRYLENMLKTSLHRGDLGAAAFWRGRMYAEWESEVTRSRKTDIDEGTARFAEAISAAIAELGCDATDEALVAKAFEHEKLFYDANAFDNDLASYEFGFLAGMALRKAGVPGWEAKVQSGTAPADVVVEGVGAVPQADASEVQSAAKAAAEARNASTKTMIGPLLDGLASSDFVRVALPQQWMAGSFGCQGFVSLTEVEGQPDAVLAYAGKHESPSHDMMEAKQVSVLEAETPCANLPWAFVAAIPASAVTQTNGTLTSTDEGIVFANVPGTIVSASDGTKWVCPTVAAQ